MADVQRVRGGIEADIGGDAPRQRARVERLEVRALVDESAVLKGPQEVGAGRCHRFTGSCWLEAAACGGRRHLTQSDRKSVVKGKSVSVRVDLGGRRILKKKKSNILDNKHNNKRKKTAQN